jgi:2-keto-4-pentenoate hydratase
VSFIEEAAIDILSRFLKGEHFPADWKGRFSLAEGYQVQLRIAEMRAAAGEPQSGWKVGLTAKAIQEMEGFDEPIFAALFESGYRASGAQLSHAKMINPAFENELCVVLREAFAGPGATAAGARQAIATVSPALEIVERRGVLSDAPPLGIADNLGQKAYIVGSAVAVAAQVNLAAATCAVKVNDETILSGEGKAVLGDPLNSVAWLANKLAEFGRRIEPGQAIMTGSFTVPTPLNVGDRVQTTFSPFGAVAVEIV